MVAISIFFGFYAKNVNSVLQWLVSGLWGGYLAANVLKWYWWRFNGHGYFFGMLTGIAAALIFPVILPPLFPSIPSDIILLYFFPAFLIISLTGCIIGTYIAPPTKDEVLIDFYTKVRPWGFWKPIHEKVLAINPDFKKNTNFKRDMFNIFIGIIWQTALIAMPIFLVLKNFTYFGITVSIILVTSIILKFSWWDKLED